MKSFADQLMGRITLLAGDGWGLLVLQILALLILGYIAFTFTQ